MTLSSTASETSSSSTVDSSLDESSDSETSGDSGGEWEQLFAEPSGLFQIEWQAVVDDFDCHEYNVAELSTLVAYQRDAQGIQVAQQFLHEGCAQSHASAWHSLAFDTTLQLPAMDAKSLIGCRDIERRTASMTNVLVQEITSESARVQADFRGTLYTDIQPPPNCVAKIEGILTRYVEPLVLEAENVAPFDPIVLHANRFVDASMADFKIAGGEQNIEINVSNVQPSPEAMMKATLTPASGFWPPGETLRLSWSSLHDLALRDPAQSTVEVQVHAAPAAHESWDFAKDSADDWLVLDGECTVEQSTPEVPGTLTCWTSPELVRVAARIQVPAGQRKIRLVMATSDLIEELSARLLRTSPTFAEKTIDLDAAKIESDNPDELPRYEFAIPDDFHEGLWFELRLKTSDNLFGSSFRMQSLMVF